MNQVVKYFEGERAQCSVGIVIALIAIALGTYFLRKVNTEFYRGMAYPFLIISVFLLIICTGVVFRSPGDIKRINGFIRDEPQKISTIELPRMVKVMERFKMIKVIEICLAIAGLGMLIFLTNHSFTRGIGAGVFILSVAMFCFDYLAEKRGEIYLDFLETFK